MQHAEHYSAAVWQNGICLFFNPYQYSTVLAVIQDSTQYCTVQYYCMMRLCGRSKSESHTVMMLYIYWPIADHIVNSATYFMYYCTVLHYTLKTNTWH